MSLWKSSKPKPHRTRLGILLVKYGAEQAKIDSASETFYVNQNKLFGEFCVASKACTRDQLNLSLSEQAAERGDYDEATKYIERNAVSSHMRILEHLGVMAAQIALLMSSQKGR
jgi:hypothetical protein